MRIQWHMDTGEEIIVSYKKDMSEVGKKHYCVTLRFWCFLDAIFNFIHYVLSCLFNLYILISVSILPYFRRMLKLLTYPRISAFAHNKGRPSLERVSIQCCYNNVTSFQSQIHITYNTRIWSIFATVGFRNLFLTKIN